MNISNKNPNLAFENNVYLKCTKKGSNYAKKNLGQAHKFACKKGFVSSNERMIWAGDGYIVPDIANSALGRMVKSAEDERIKTRFNITEQEKVIKVLDCLMEFIKKDKKTKVFYYKDTRA